MATAHEIRSLIEKTTTGTHRRRVPEEVKEQVRRYAERRRAQGSSWEAIARETGLEARKLGAVAHNSKFEILAPAIIYENVDDSQEVVDAVLFSHYSNVSNHTTSFGDLGVLSDLFHHALNYPSVRGVPYGENRIPIHPATVTSESGVMFIDG